MKELMEAFIRGIRQGARSFVAPILWLGGRLRGRRRAS